jgi:hypothetical protein
VEKQTFPEYPGFGRFWGFRDSGVWPDSGIPGRGPSSGQIRDLAGIGQIWGPGRGPESGVFGVRNRGFPGSGIRGKSTLSATMVSVVSTSTDPDFEEDLEKIRKSGVPARKKRAPGTPKSSWFRGPRGPRIPTPDFGFFGVRGQISGFRGFRQISGFRGFSQISGFRVPWGLKRRFWRFLVFWVLFVMLAVLKKKCGRL